MQHSEKFSALLCEVLDNNLNEKANDHSLGTATHTRGTIAGISPGPRRHSRVGSGRESKNHRFSIKNLWKSIDFSTPEHPGSFGGSGDGSGAVWGAQRRNIRLFKSIDLGAIVEGSWASYLFSNFARLVFV